MFNAYLWPINRLLKKTTCQFFFHFLKFCFDHVVFSVLVRKLLSDHHSNVKHLFCQNNDLRGIFGFTEEPYPWNYFDQIGLDKIAEIVGAHKDEVVLMNGSTVNLHILLMAFYQPTPTRHKILLESKAFPSHQYAIESQIRLKGYNVEESRIWMKAKEVQDFTHIFPMTLPAPISYP